MKRLIWLLVFAIGCGPSIKDNSGDDDSQNPIDAGVPNLPDAWAGPVGSVSGTVWAPGNAPGMVPSGHEIPIYNALVYLSNFRPEPIPDMVYCEQCQDTPGKAILTDERGHFVIPNVVPATYWLVIQKGQFRLEQQITVSANQVIDLPASQTTMPSQYDPEGGRWIPHIALASGLYDQMEDIVGKMGIGQVDSSGLFVPASALDPSYHIDIYSNDGNADSVAVGSLADLVSNLDRMRQYHIIFIPCSTSYNTDGLQGFDPTVRENIREYVNEGGKLYVTDWSGEWEDNVFPAEIQFASDSDTPASAYNAATNTWDTSQFGDADGFPSYESQHARADDAELHDWLNGQVGPVVLPDWGGYGVGTYNAGDFVIEGNWDHIMNLPSVQIGVDDEGFPVTDTAHAFIIGDEDGGPVTHPLTVTFEPTGCGRVLYSTYHTAENIHSGLVPQERVLLYLIMEIGVCKSGPIVN